MKIAPVKQYTDPKYPTRSAVDRDPTLLRAVPARWYGHALVLTAVAATCGIVTARWAICAEGETEKEQPPTTSRVAPLFVHGEGRGSYGCMAVNAPTFLSEDEARQVVQQELLLAGIDCTPTQRTFELTVPVFKVKQDEPDGDGVMEGQPPEMPVTAPLSLEVDGEDVQRGIAFEYISLDDSRKWPGYMRWLRSMADTVDTQQTAGLLREALVEAKPAGAFGVFYDPQTKMSDLPQPLPMKTGEGGWEYPDREEARRLARELSRESLRLQVKDFIAWLKAEGVI